MGMEEEGSVIFGGGKRDDLVLCGESEEDLREMVGRFVEV